MAVNEATAERRQQILAAAMTCFMRKGYHRATMDDIVSESGLSKGTLYWYFDSKKALFLALVQSTLEQIGLGWQALIEDSEKSASEKLRNITTLFRVELGEMALFFGIMMEAWALTRHDPEVEVLVKNIYTPYLENMTQLIKQGVASGEFEAESAEKTATVILILYDGLTLAKGLKVIDTDWEQLLDTAELLLFRGLGIEGYREK
ncbi:MAG: TetR family transcriptional regulator [Chloroflexi bacterium]|jgi:AcrR family transcriptional regulator|nr:TetR family transcriptional regulator [Chloroflexota bacterium]